MARVDLIPSRKISEEARQKGIRPYDLLKEKTCRYNTNGDKREMNKNGTEYLRDILITRKDGTRIIIRQNPSGYAGLQVLQLTSLNCKNQIESKLIAVTHGIDFARLQMDGKYLDAIGENLLSRERLARKVTEARSYGNNEYIYVGTISQNKETGQFERMAFPYKNIANRIQQQKLEDRDNAKKFKEKQKEDMMRNTLKYKLNNMPSKQLKTICDALGIKEDELKDNTIENIVNER